MPGPFFTSPPAERPVDAPADALEQRVGALEATPGGGDTSELEGRVDGIDATLLTIGGKIDDLEASPGGDVTTAQHNAGLNRIASLESSRATKTELTTERNRIATLEANRAMKTTVASQSTRIDTVDGRVADVETALASVRDQTLIVFETIQERDQYPDTYSGFRATTITGNTWAIHNGSSYVTRSRAEVLRRVGFAYAKVAPTDDENARAAQDARVQDHVQTIGREIPVELVETFDAT